MNCGNPYIHKGNAFGCGQCIPCRVNKRREWTHRIILEASLQEDNAFLSVDYSEENLPDDLSVSPREISLFIKRLRKGGLRFRYFAVGEYGDHSFRPHYHLALFGIPTCLRGTTRQATTCCAVCESIKRAWGLGRIVLGTLTPQSAAYIAGYVTKKMTSEYDPRLEGRRPEFARMSLRPGIGYNVMHEVASTLLEFDLHKVLIDVPHSLQHGKKKWPLGRYLRRSLRALIGKDKNQTEQSAAQLAEKLQAMREAAFNNSEPLKKHVLSASEGRRIQIHSNETRKKKAITL